MTYPTKNTRGPRPQIAAASVRQRLASLIDESEMADVNLLSKLNRYRCGAEPDVKLVVFSPTDLQPRDFDGAKIATYSKAVIGDGFGPSWVCEHVFSDANRHRIRTDRGRL